MKLSIVVPVYNEEKTVWEILEKLHRVKLPKRVTKEVIVINDGSTDQTTQILKKIKYKEFKIFKTSKNQGKGAALRYGFKFATGNIITIQDADLEYNPEDFKKLIKPILDGRALVVYGDRFDKYPLKIWGKDKTILPSHWLGNHLLTILTNILYGVWLKDMETCYKLINRQVLEELELRSNEFNIEPEITAQILKKGYKIVEIPIKVKPRTHKEGKKISWKDGVAAVLTLVRHRFKN